MKDSPKSKVRVGILGLGFGELVHIPAFQMCPDAEVVGIFSRNLGKAERIAQKYGIQFVTNDYTRIISHEDIDMVSIATPPHMHKEMILTALAAKKHTLCEKPLAVNAEQAEEIARAISGNERLCVMGHQMRYQPSRIAIKNILEGGDLGRIFHVTLSYDTSNRVDPNGLWNWWSDLSAGGGQLNAMGSHQIDLLRWWFGEAVSVSGVTNTAYPRRLDASTGNMRDVTADEFCQFQIGFKTGVVASVSLSSVAIGWRTSSIQIYGEKGALFLDGEEKLTMIRKTSATHDITEKDPLLTVPWVSGSIWRASFAHMVNSIISSIQEGQEYRGASFIDGLMNQRIIDAVRLSSDTGRRIFLNKNHKHAV